MSSTSGNSGISLFGHFPWIRWLAIRFHWIPNLSWPFYKAMQTNPPSMVGDVFVQLQQQIFVFPKEFSTCSKDVMSPGWHGRSWLFSLWLRPPSLPATSSLTGRASAPSQAWRNRELCITFARPPIRTRKVFQRKHANWQISLRTSDIVTPAKYTVDMFSAHSWRSLCKDWHLFPPQFNHQPNLWRWIWSKSWMAETGEQPTSWTGRSGWSSGDSKEMGFQTTKWWTYRLTVWHLKVWIAPRGLLYPKYQTNII